MTAIHTAVIKPSPAALDVERIRRDFPILKLRVNGKPLVFLDNAASSQMPQPVIDRWVRYQTSQHANIHRAVHYLSETATAEYEAARRKAQYAFLAAMGLTLLLSFLVGLNLLPVQHWMYSTKSRRQRVRHCLRLETKWY